MGGGKYGRQNRRKSRREIAEQKRLAEAARTWSPDADEETEEQTIYTDVTATMRVTERTVRYVRSGMLAEFAVIVSELRGDEWAERLCIDTCNHGNVHRHRDGNHKVEPEVIRSIQSASDVQIGLSDAVDEAYDLFEDQEG